MESDTFGRSRKSRLFFPSSLVMDCIYESRISLITVVADVENENCLVAEIVAH